MRRLAPAATIVASTLVFCVLVPGLAAGDDAPAAETPAARASRVAAAFPEPSEKGAYSYALDYAVGGKRIGQATFSAAPDMLDGKAVWKIVDDLTAQTEGIKHAFHSTAWLAKDTSVVKAESSIEEDGSEPVHVSAARTDAGLRVTVQAGKADPGVSDWKTENLVLCPVGSVILFLRQAPAGPADYAFASYDPTEGTVKPATISVKGPGTWTEGEKPVDTWWAVANLGEHDTEFHLSPARELLAAKNRAQGTILAKPGLVKAQTPVALKPATSAKEAAIRFALGSNVGDLDLVMSSLHVPTLYAAAKQAGVLMSESDYRAQLVQNIKAALQHMKREEVEPVVTKAGEAAVVTKEGDATKIVFAEPLQMLEFLAKEFDGAWYLVKLPGT